MNSLILLASLVIGNRFSCGNAGHNSNTKQLILSIRKVMTKTNVNPSENFFKPEANCWIADYKKTVFFVHAVPIYRQ